MENQQEFFKKQQTEFIVGTEKRVIFYCDYSHTSNTSGIYQDGSCAQRKTRTKRRFN
jgi:hypothetical protein